MFYLIQCTSDKSYCVVEDYEVVLDNDNSPAVNSSVYFYWKSEKYLGTIVDSSNDDAQLKELAKKLAKKRKKLDPENESPLPEKRLRKPKKSFSFTNDENLLSPVETKKKVLNNKDNGNLPKKNLKQQVEDLIYETPDNAEKKSLILESDDESRSPTKEELKKIIFEQKKLMNSGKTSDTDSKLKSRKVPSRFFHSSDSDDNITDNRDDEKREEKCSNDDESKKIKKFDGSSDCSPQLYGKNCGEEMILLKNGIYCTKRAFDDAVDYSRNSATSFLRRIMDGVFKPTAILNCTYSGRPPNAQGPVRQSAKVQALDRIAKKAVIEFFEDYASTKGWSKASPTKMRRAVSQWVGERKRQINKNNEKSA